jgi:plastocyanin
MKITGIKTVLAAAVLAAVGILLFASGCQTSSSNADLIAENNAFNKSTFRVDAGSAITITFENKDNTAHNFAVYESKNASRVFFRGETLNRKGTTTYTFTAPDTPGDYYFQDDNNPSTMNGSFVVYGTSS